MKVVAVASGKGGVGKTSSAVHLATGFAKEGKRVLLVDLDHGGHATRWLTGSNRVEAGIAEALVDEELLPEHLQVVPARPGLIVAPASAALEKIEASLANVFQRETILRTVLRAARKPQFDIVVIDCPPGVEFLVKSAIYAADAVIIPVLPGFLGLTGVQDIEALTQQIRKRGRAKVEVIGCVIFQSDDRELITEETRQTIRKLRLHLFGAEVRVSTAAKRLPMDKATAFDDGADDRGLEDYRALLKEVGARL